MDVRVAARNMLTLLDKSEEWRGTDSKREEHGMGIPHALFLLNCVAEGVTTGEKAHRWLAWAQCILVYEKVADLSACKYGNLFS